MAKPASQSQTVWGGAIATAAGILTLMVAAKQPIDRIVNRHAPSYRADASDLISIVEIVLGAVSTMGGTAAILGRLKASEPVYTPDALPGHDKSDFEGTGDGSWEAGDRPN